jgi:hypothetical protein
VQQPSSLVFVAIILGWAAYLLPQWVHRREALSQSRGRDRHSSGLRVLHRRRRVSGGPSSVPLLPDPRTIGDPVVDPLAANHADSRHGGPSRPGAEVSACRPAVATASAVAARRRARVLSTLMVLTATVWAATLVVPEMAAVGWLLTGLLGLDLVALVISGRRRAVRRASLERAQLERARRLRVEEARRDERRHRVVHEADAATMQAAVTPAVGEQDAARLVTVAASHVERASERVARELAEGTPSDTWTPVPVPPPTYTLKPAVPRPEPAPLDPPCPPPQSTEPAACQEARGPRSWGGDRTFADELDLDAVLARRRAVNG